MRFNEWRANTARPLRRARMRCLIFLRDVDISVALLLGRYTLPDAFPTRRSAVPRSWKTIALALLAASVTLTAQPATKQIGRASCRERVYMLVGAVEVK